MHPFVAEQLAGARIAELRREADAARVARRVRAKRVRRGFRVALGGRLIRMGVRLAGSTWTARAEGPVR